MSKKFFNNSKYSRPIPIELINFNQIYYNPIKLCKDFFSKKKIIVLFDFDDYCFKVLNNDEMNFLWNNGFYGKGILSRSEPTWYIRAKKRILGIQSSELYSEEVIKYRRVLREEWKFERKKVLEYEKNLRLNGLINDSDELIKLELAKEKLNKLKENINKSKPASLKNSENSINLKILRVEDTELLIDSTSLQNIEYLELTPFEVLFLIEIDVVKVENFNLISLFKELCQNYGDIKPDNWFVLQYLVYYHYKSLGWCVKSGLKFSSDFLLYQRGPPFNHAEFAISIINNDSMELQDLTYYSSIFRVVSAVKKSLILCFVSLPTPEEFDDIWLNLKNENDLIRLLNLYTIEEINYKRWIPSRTRM